MEILYQRIPVISVDSGWIRFYTLIVIGLTLHPIFAYEDFLVYAFIIKKESRTLKEHMLISGVIGMRMKLLN